MPVLPRSFIASLVAVASLVVVGCRGKAPPCSGGGSQGDGLCRASPECGNGIVEGSEQCDDGNNVDADGCEADCTLPVCGNGIVDASEACDDGNRNDADGCEADCTLPVCGNGIVDENEACDDGNAIDGDACESDCTLPVCGNGIVDENEACDDGNATDGDACESNCTLPACGNHIVDADEQCDDGNENGGDGCENDCTTTPAPSDLDGDGVPDASDNCPSVANRDQADADGDALGDACDTCPQPNPANSACPVTIYELKTPNSSGAYAYDGMLVTLSNQLVTAVAPDGFFIQVGEVERGDAGADDSAIFVETGSAPSVAAGDRVDIASAVPTSASGEERLGSVSGLSTVSTGNALPAPVAASSADLADNGARARALDAVLVTIADATVTDTQPAPGSGDGSAPYEFVVDGSGLRVDDELYAISPTPMLNEVFTSLTGIHDFRYGHYRLEPRGASDVVFGPPFVVGFAPAFSYVDVGQTNAYTAPDPLTLTISRAQSTDTFVAIDTSDPNALLVPGGGVTISAGQTSAPVKVTAIQSSPDVSLTTGDGTGPSADVRVINRAYETPNLVGLTPSTAGALPGGSATFTVTLDMPAPNGGTPVSISMNPANGFGTFATPVVVPAGALSASFDVTLDAAAFGSAQLTASAGTGTLTATVEALHLASVRITELNPAIAGGKDLVELVVSSGGRLEGYSLRIVSGANGATTTLATLPAVNLDTGEVLLVHLNSASGCTETSATNQCPASSNAADAYSDAAWDVAATSSLGPSGLETGAQVLTVQDSGDNLLDGVPYSDPSVADASVSPEFPSWVAFIQSGGVWDPTACSDVASCRARAVQVGALPGSASSSVRRTDTSNPGAASQWTAAGASNFGSYP